jgi:hypothetical protein
VRVHGYGRNVKYHGFSSLPENFTTQDWETDLMRTLAGESKKSRDQFKEVIHVLCFLLRIENAEPDYRIRDSGGNWEDGAIFKLIPEKKADLDDQTESIERTIRRCQIK